MDRVVTLGSPHYGSRIAALFPPLGAAAQLRYQSPFIRELATGALPGSARYFSIYSNMDNFVLPVSTAVLHGQKKTSMCPIWDTARCCTAPGLWIRLSAVCSNRFRARSNTEAPAS